MPAARSRRRRASSASASCRCSASATTSPLCRRDYFEPPLQKLLGFGRTPAFAQRAADLGGYEIAGLGQVHYNGP